VKTGHTFAGWNTAADGNGTDRAAGDKFNITANTTLFAKWTPTPTGTLAEDPALVGKVTITDATTVTLTEAVSLTNPVTVPAGVTLNTGAFALSTTSTLTVNGTLTVAATGSLVLTGDASNGAQISGTGKVVAAKTEITGEWQAVGSGDVTIAATSANESSITGASGVVLTAGTDGTITQLAEASNNLTIAANTTIDLQGTISSGTSVGTITLTESTTAVDEGGKLTFDAATSIIKVGDESDAGSVLNAAAGDFVDSGAAATTKITVSDFGNVLIDAGNTTSAKVNTIKGGTASGYLQAFGSSGGSAATVSINASTSI
jgi:uncharacterized repeat protein (TIGR02543 family)